MRVNLQENQFHLIMAVLLVGSLFLDQLAASVMGAWNPPEIGFVTFVLGMVWVALLATHRAEIAREKLDVMQDRLERMERKLNAWEDEERAR